MALILFPAQGAQGAIAGLRLCGTALIPALLPYLLITRLLGEYLPLPKKKRYFLGLSSIGWYGIAMSFLGGYPTGVATAVSLYKKGSLSKTEAEDLIPFCNNSGPGFFVGVLGVGVFGCVKKGLFLYGIHVLTALWGILMFPRKRQYNIRFTHEKEREKHPFPKVFQEALGDTCNAMIRICGLVILFSLIRGLIGTVLPTFLMRYMGLLELSSGLLATGKDDLVLWAVYMGWGGLCVHMQAMNLWQEAGLKIRGYFPRKALHGIMSAMLTMGILWGYWYVVGIYFLICPIFPLFYKNWGRKNGRLAL